MKAYNFYLKKRLNKNYNIHIELFSNYSMLLLKILYKKVLKDIQLMII